MSDQRRALLLPQEVKELGLEEAIIFCEGLRPIRCLKIRYFNDPLFRKRLMLPPAIPVPSGGGTVMTQLASAPANPEILSAPQSAATAVAPKREEVVSREATVEDIERIELLTLQDFASDFSKVPIPEKDGPLSDPEMKLAVDSFLSSLERT